MSAATDPTAGPAEHDGADRALARGKALVTPALRATVDGLADPIRDIAAYHLGWVDASGRPTDADTGKALRPTLVVLAAEAVGGSAAAALPAAVAVELVHNFSLLHDDVMDGDTHRRHRRTAWTVFGTSHAILAGDALLNLATRTLADHDHPGMPDQLRTLGDAVRDLLAGQADDLHFEDADVISPVEYQDMARNKTAALLAASCALGALAGHAHPDQTRALRGFGEYLGLAFQYTDDILGIWGDPAVTGKPATSDLSRGKKTLPVVTALAADTPPAHELAGLYRHGHPLDVEDAARAATLIAATGARRSSHDRIATELGHALQYLDEVTDSDTPTIDTLRELAGRIAHRTR